MAKSRSEADSVLISQGSQVDLWEHVPKNFMYGKET